MKDKKIDVGIIATLITCLLAVIFIVLFVLINK